MSHITEIALENYRSFRAAHCRLSPFTLIVGANNAGKSNLLKAVRDVAVVDLNPPGWLNAARHHSSDEARVKVFLRWNDGNELEVWERHDGSGSVSGSPARLAIPLRGWASEIYRLDPTIIGTGEGGSGEPYITPDGAGVAWMLDKWNAGSRAMRARFDQVETALRRCVPEIEKLSFYDEDVGKRAIQVEQTGLPPEPRPLSEVSDGTRLVLAILTLVNQETPPPVLLLEDIDRGLHPRLYEQLTAFLRALAAQGHTQILATTHDPYLIDEFRDTPEAVVIVDKKDGASTLSNLDEHLAALRSQGADLEMPLGQVWFSGMVGGVPGMKLPEILRPAKA